MLTFYAFEPTASAESTTISNRVLLRSRLSTFIKTCRIERKAGENQQVVTISDHVFLESWDSISSFARRSHF